MQVREIATAAATNPNLFTQYLSMIQDQHLLAQLTCHPSAE
jgi:hypothetical protein